MTDVITSRRHSSEAPALVDAAFDALFEAHTANWVKTEAGSIDCAMRIDDALVPPNPVTEASASICAQHPELGLLGREAYARHLATHAGAEPSCASCGTPIEVTTPVAVGLGFRHGYRVISSDGSAFEWFGPVDVRGAGVCAELPVHGPNPHVRHEPPEGA